MKYYLFELVTLCACFVVRTATALGENGDGAAEQASPATVAVNLSHAVRSAADGKVRGRVIAIHEDGSLQGVAGAAIHFIRHCKPAGRPVRSNIDGSFEISELQPGLYSVVATSGRRFATFALTISPSVQSNRAETIQPSPVEVLTIPLTMDCEFPAIAEIVGLPFADAAIGTSSSATSTSGSYRIGGSGAGPIASGAAGLAPLLGVGLGGGANVPIRLSSDDAPLVSPSAAPGSTRN